MKEFVNGKVDKGFELTYYRLSHRRRFIRTLWMLPMTAVFLVPLVDETVTKVVHLKGWLVMVVCLLATVVQAAYEYGKWQKEEAGRPPVV